MHPRTRVLATCLPGALFRVGRADSGGRRSRRSPTRSKPLNEKKSSTPSPHKGTRWVVGVFLCWFATPGPYCRTRSCRLFLLSTVLYDITCRRRGGLSGPCPPLFAVEHGGVDCWPYRGDTSFTLERPLITMILLERTTAQTVVMSMLRQNFVDRLYAECSTHVLYR